MALDRLQRGVLGGLKQEKEGNRNKGATVMAAPSAPVVKAKKVDLD